MKLKTILLTLAATAAAFANAATIDGKWCTIEYPDQWNYREETNGFEIKVTLKPSAPVEGAWLQPHLHWMRLMGYGGFQAWQNPVRKPEVGKTYKFRYNPKVNESLASLENFANLHPLQDDADAQGALELMYNLQEALKKITGMDAITLQPAAGAHGELTGMMIVKKY